MSLQPITSTPAHAQNPVITDDEAGALARATVNLFKAWGLSDAQSRTLLGDMSQSTWDRWKRGDIGRVDRDRKMRMAHLMGIHKGIRHLFNEPKRGYAWVKKENDDFEGNSALDVMLRGEMSDLESLRRWLNAERGVW
ncbi:antitoxin Xre-like helix-turn-helix domain-containing protein [Roseibium sp.]|uniref:antitoxin Xre-like helix-turn-helix domain-containing protein n=1 Tax=Roseibium sp. TaxID=1936156 RepID=UPI003B5085EC